MNSKNHPSLEQTLEEMSQKSQKIAKKLGWAKPILVDLQAKRTEAKMTPTTPEQTSTMVPFGS